ncbi:N-acetylmuramoyl-L-alanine amidase [Halanaerobaculum tunisiense]
MPKKLLMGLLIIVIVASCASSLFAAENIKLKVNGNVVTADLDYQIVDENILIPLQMLSDTLPVKVKWFDSIETFRLQLRDQVVKLKMGDKNLQVNDELVKLPVAARRVDDQVMVPLQSLGEALGLVIKSDSRQQVVDILEVQSQLKEINYCQKEKYEGVKVKVSKQVDYDLQFFQDPDRLVLDLEGTHLDKELQKLKVESDLIKRARVAQFNRNTARVVLDLKADLDYKLLTEETKDSYQYLLKVSPLITGVDYKQGRLQIASTGDLTAGTPVHLSEPNRIAIDLKNAVLKEGQQLKIADSFFKQIRISQYKTKPDNIVRVVFEPQEALNLRTMQQESGLQIKALLAKLQGVDYQFNQANQITFNLNNQQQPEVLPLTNRDRLVFDFPNTINEVDKEKMAVDSDFIEEIRIAQFNKSTTRVVVDLTQLVPYQLNWVDEQLQVKLMNKLQAVKVTDDKAQPQVNLSLLTTGNYELYQLTNPSRLVVDLPNTTVPEEVKLTDKSAIVSNIRYSQYSTNPHNVRVVLDLKEDINLNHQPQTEIEEINVALNRNNLAGKVVTIDPGHGGSDPGALGSSLREKNVVLDIALKLQQTLEQAGAKVVMTRQTDQFVPLKERTELANKLNSDIFVSIHANSHQEQNPVGTETFVVDKEGNDSYLLANFVQQQLVTELDTLDRGIKSDGLYVLEHTTMPAILSEVAFLSNPQQEELLADSEFKESAAVGLYRGISKYFKLLLEEET